MFFSRTSSIFLNFFPSSCVWLGIKIFFSSNLLHPKIIKFTHILAEPLYVVITYDSFTYFINFSQFFFSSSYVCLGKVFTRFQLNIRRINLRKVHKNVMGIHTLLLNHPNDIVNYPNDNKALQSKPYLFLSALGINMVFFFS
jgi:hypothetical protein